MTQREYLNEERFQKNKKKITIVACVILIIGLAIGGTAIAKGLMSKGEIEDKYSQEHKNQVSKALEEERQVLQTKKAELEAKGVTYSGATDYTDGEAYELKLIVQVQDPSFAYYRFSEYQNHPLTATYCDLIEELENLNSDFAKSAELHQITPYYMIGGFIIVFSCMVGGMIFMIAKRREMAAFSAQQVMPVAKEAVEEMAPTAGTVAKEIAKGIKEGLDEDQGQE